MKKSKKIALWVATALVGVGLALSLVAAALAGFNWNALNTMHFVTNTYAVQESFSNIQIDGAECDVRFCAAENGVCRVVCKESDHISHAVAVQGDTLTVQRHDDRAWYERFGVYWGDMCITVYLPQREYAALSVYTLSGDIAVPRDFTFATATLKSASGDVSVAANVTESLTVQSTSGDVRVSNTALQSLTAQSTSGEVILTEITVAYTLQARSVSGDVQISNATCDRLDVEATSGDVKLADVRVDGELTAETVSGDVRLTRCDADSLRLETTSGDVSGSLLSGKQFITKTTSGDVNVPNSVSGGTCQVDTVSGDIHLTIENS